MFPLNLEYVKTKNYGRLVVSGAYKSIMRAVIGGPFVRDISEWLKCANHDIVSKYT